MRSFNGETITLGRGIHETPNVIASPTLREAEEIIPGVSVTRVEFQQWGIDVCDYCINGEVVVPEVGDTITRCDGSVYRVLPAGGTMHNAPAYRYVTNTRTRYLIHSELVTPAV